LSDKIKEKGINSFVTEMTTEILRRYCDDMEIDSKEVSRADVEEQITYEVMLLGLEAVLGNLKVSTLKDFFAPLQIPKVPFGTKKEGIIEFVVLKLYRDDPSVVVPPSTPPKFLTDVIKKETSTPFWSANSIETAARTPTNKELHGMYARDLRDYLKEHRLSYDGSKPVLVDRVLRFLGNEGDTVGSGPPTPLKEGDNADNDVDIVNNSDTENNQTTNGTNTATNGTNSTINATIEANKNMITLRRSARKSKRLTSEFRDSEDSGLEDVTLSAKKSKKARLNF